MPPPRSSSPPSSSTATADGPLHGSALCRATLRRVAAGLWRDGLARGLIAALLLLTALAPAQVASYPALVDWPTVLALTGLLVLTKGLEASGALHRLGRWLIDRLATERAMALGLVAAAAALSTLLTNDVALFVVVPLTLGVCRLAGLPATRLVIFEALAVNVGSSLTPIGNPQNLFLWQLAGVSFGAFVRHMLPLVAVLMALLLALTAASFPGRRVSARSEAPPAALDRPLLAAALALYAPFLVAIDLHHAGGAVAAVLGTFLLLRPRVLAEVDWGLLLIFMLMFIDLRLVAALPWVQHAMGQLGLDQATHLYAAAIAASQLISNVPAAIALAEHARQPQAWQVLAYGVNVGGFGLAIGSLANLIALRLLGRERGALWRFHAHAVPCLLVAAAVGAGWLFWAAGA